jgi:hypothetical protein
MLSFPDGIMFDVGGGCSTLSILGVGSSEVSHGEFQ